MNIETNRTDVYCNNGTRATRKVASRHNLHDDVPVSIILRTSALYILVRVDDIGF